MLLQYRCTILGAGQFGKALADVIAKTCDNETNIRLFDTTPDTYKHFDISNNLSHACFAAEAEDTALENHPLHIIITALPASEVEKSIKQVIGIGVKDPLFLLVSKGTNEKGVFLPIALKEAFPDIKLASLAGPHFARDLASSHVTSLISCDRADEAFLRRAFKLLNPEFNREVLGNQILSVMKNMAAYCCGFAKRLNFSENTIATLFGVFLNNAKQLLRHFNCCTDIPIPIISDWFLCCTSPVSRNYAAGLLAGCLHGENSSSCNVAGGFELNAKETANGTRTDAGDLGSKGLKKSALTESMRSAPALKAYLAAQNLHIPAIEVVARSLEDIEEAKNYIGNMVAMF